MRNALAITIPVLLTLTALTMTPVFAASTCSPAGTTGLTAMIIAKPHQRITGMVNAAGCDLGIYIGPGITHVTIKHATITGANDHAILAQDTSHLTIEQSMVTGNGVAPHTCSALQASTHCINEDKAVELDGTSHSIIRDNTVTLNVADGGIGITDDGQITPGALNSGQPLMSTHNIIINNTLKDDTGGCEIVVSAYNAGGGDRDNLILHNTILGTSPGNGPFIGQIVIATDGPNATISNTMVEGNTIHGSLLPGIVVHSNAPGDKITETRIINNDISDNGFYPPTFASIHTPVADNGTTGIALIAEDFPGEPSAPVLTHTLLVSNTITNDMNGVWLCNASHTRIVDLDGNAILPIVKC